MVDKEEVVVLHIVLDMVEKVMDKVKDVMNEYKLDLLMLVLLDQVQQLKLVLFANVPYDQMNLVKHNELVVQHHKYPKKVDIVDQLMANNLDHYRMKKLVIMIQENLINGYQIHIHNESNHLNHMYHHMMMANVFQNDNYLMMNHMMDIDYDEVLLLVVNNRYLHDYIYL